MAKRKLSSAKLKATDYEPLLVAISSRAVDTCLMGAHCLALLEDPRAFGLLMQLSREDDAAVRLETCRSLAMLGDRRATERLGTLLVDDDAKVRDAAFSALEKICDGSPLEVAEDGLAASFEDIRRRGLELLVRIAKKSRKKKPDDDVAQLLRQALNDPAEAVRGEALKYALNANVGGEHRDTLRFLLNSVHANVRREVLNEAMAEEKQPWSQPLMLELLDDPDAGIRGESFSWLQKKFEKRDEIDWLATAINSQHVDIRSLACQELIKQKTDEAQAILAAAINDDERDIRQLVLQSLIGRNATAALVSALDSVHVSVRLAAANALAKNSDERAKPVLFEVAGKSWPLDRNEEQKIWIENIILALDGLAFIDDPEVVPLLVTLAESEAESVRHKAANSLIWTTHENFLQLIQPLLRASDDQVRLPATLSSATHGDMVSAREILNADKSSSIDIRQRLWVAVALGEPTENQLVQMLDAESLIHPNIALLVLLCRDWLDHDGSPRRIISALAARDARLRLHAAKALQAFGNPDLLASMIKDVFENRADDPDYQLDAEVVRGMAALLAFGRQPVLCRALDLLEKLNQPKQNEFDAGWRWLSGRYTNELAAALSLANGKTLPASETDDSTLNQLAFGTYVGLAREQGGYHHHRRYPRYGWSIIDVRRAALNRLYDLTEKNKEFLEPAICVITNTCGDPLTEVRTRAFEILQELKVDDQRRAEIGIGCGHLDLAIQGLSLLTQAAKPADRKATLKTAIMEQLANVAAEAARMLNADIGSVETCEVCLESSHPRLALNSVSWLADDYQQVPAARKMLQKLASDGPRGIRERAIQALVFNQDPTAFESVCVVLRETKPTINAEKCFQWLLELQDDRAPAFLLGLMESSNLDLDDKLLLQTIGSFRNREVVAELLQMMERKKLAGSIVSAVTKISGFDQVIVDRNDDSPDRNWMNSQHPRHGDVLADLISRCIEFGETRSLTSLIGSARWCLSDEVNEPLARLVANPEDNLRRAAIEAISFRAEKRDGSVDALRSALEHKDPTTAFLAAEGMANAGRNDGLQVLLSAVEMMPDLRMRQRAVLALGKLADLQTLDRLLNLVTHDGHALQESAAEAIGYLGQSDQREKILKLLKRLITQETSAGERALKGLRHMNTSASWDMLRDQAENNYGNMRLIAVEQLGYDSADSTQQLLLRLLEDGTIENAYVILQAAKRSFGVESVLPDVAFFKGLKGEPFFVKSVEVECVNRICQKATPAQIFAASGTAPGTSAETLSSHLLGLDPPPADEAIQALQSEDARTAGLAANVIGRVGNKQYGKQIGTALGDWLQSYAEKSSRIQLQNLTPDATFNSIESAIRKMIWAAGRSGGLEKQLLEIAVGNVGNDHFVDIRVAAIRALPDSLAATTVKQLRGMLADHDSRIRTAAAERLAELKTPISDIGEELLADRQSFTVIARNAEDAGQDATVQTAASSAHYQSLAVPRLIQMDDATTLSTVASDGSLDFNTRVGAIEGLAVIATKDGDNTLVNIGNDEGTDPELRKAAWRGLRRSKRRAQLKANSK